LLDLVKGHASDLEDILMPNLRHSCCGKDRRPFGWTDIVIRRPSLLAMCRNIDVC